MHLDDNMKQLDLALIMGGDDLEQLNQKSSKRKLDIKTDQSKRTKLDFGELPVNSLDRTIGKDPPEEEFPSIDRFCIYLEGNPCLLKNLVKTWPAFQKWKDLNYFHQNFGFRTVPVEVGKHYLDAEWGQELITVTEFLEKYIARPMPPDKRGYLAQHPLFDQIPKLKEDILVPEYCSLKDKDVPVINAWFGPKETVSPLHYDCSHNILAQVVGRKYIRLYSPEYSKILGPRSCLMERNSSKVDLDDTEEVRKARINQIEFVDLILQPGDALFIPRKWWHYVRALDISFSVSFWWDRINE